MDEKGKAVEGILITIMADIFEVIPPENPSVWAQKGSCVPVSVSYDYEKNLYRIMCVHESRCIVNSYITTDTQFMIRTGLFGTWYDPASNTTFGIGFRKLSALHDFSYAFTKAKKDSRDALARMVESVDISKKVNESANESSPRCEENDSLESEDNGTSQEQEDSYSQDEFYNLLGSYSASDFKGGDNYLARNNHAEITNEVTTLTKENCQLQRDLLESSKTLADWQAQLDVEKQRNETLLKANEHYVSKMDELNHKVQEFTIQADHWKDRYENSESICSQASEETIIKYEQDIEEALSSKEYFENLVSNQDSQIKALTTRIADYNQKVQNLKAENSSVKQKYKSTYDKTQELVEGATDQWQTLKDIEKNISKGAQKLIEVYDGIKKLVKKGGAGSWKYEPDGDEEDDDVES